MQLSTSNTLRSKSNKPAANGLNRQIILKIGLGLSSLRRAMSVWAERSRQRRALAQLSPYQLKDIGVSRGDAINEVNKPFWRS